MLKIEWTKIFNPTLEIRTEELSDHICKNCTNQVEGNFYNYCGQKKIDFNIHHIIDNLTEGLEFKRGLLFNLKVLTFTPATAMRDYMKGRTKPFLNPVSYSLIVLTVLFLTGTKLTEAFEFGGITAKMPYFLHYIVFTFPIMYALGSYLSYVSKGYNYIQHFILSLMITSHFILIFILPNMYVGINWLYILLIFLTYTIWVYQLLFKEHIAVTITNQFTILLQAMFFELIFVALTFGPFYTFFSD